MRQTVAICDKCGRQLEEGVDCGRSGSRYTIIKRGFYRFEITIHELMRDDNIHPLQMRDLCPSCALTMMNEEGATDETQEKS